MPTLGLGQTRPRLGGVFCAHRLPHFLLSGTATCSAANPGVAYPRAPSVYAILFRRFCTNRENAFSKLLQLAPVTRGAGSAPRAPPKTYRGPRPADRTRGGTITGHAAARHDDGSGPRARLTVLNVNLSKFDSAIPQPALVSMSKSYKIQAGSVVHSLSVLKVPLNVPA